jgi:hypothetical protein
MPEHETTTDKHTPGPWRTEDLPWEAGDLYVSAASGIVIVATFMACDVGIVERNANAVLAAKAPEMLAMLRRVRSTSHLSEDPALAPDIDRLVAEATEDHGDEGAANAEDDGSDGEASQP